MFFPQYFKRVVGSPRVYFNRVFGFIADRINACGTEQPVGLNLAGFEILCNQKPVCGIDIMTALIVTDCAK